MEIRSYHKLQKSYEKNTENEATIADVEEEIKALKDGTISIVVKDGKIKSVDRHISYRW